MNIDQRLEALVQTVELMAGMQRDMLRAFDAQSRDIADLKEASRQDGENIRALARIAEIHERRLSHLEGGE
jgi:hypothetical protein